MPGKSNNVIYIILPFKPVSNELKFPGPQLSATNGLSVTKYKLFVKIGC